MHTYLQVRLVLPNKEPVTKVVNGELERKTKGHYLILLYLNLVGLPTIISVITIPNVAVPIILMSAPTVIEFQKDVIYLIVVPLNMIG